MDNTKISSLNWVSRFMRPLVDVLLRRGVTFVQVSSLLKQLYFQAALQQSKAAGNRSTDSHLSLITGLQRRDIKAQRDAPDNSTEPTAISHPARAVALWLTDQRFKGRASLPKRAQNQPSFEDLARAVSQDIHPRSMLDALLAAGTVRLDGEAVILLTHAYLPSADDAAALDYFAANIADHAHAAGQNLAGQSAKHYERAVHYNHLRQSDIDELQALSAQLFQTALEQINAHASALQKQSIQGANGANMRFRSGGYFYAEKEDEQR